MKLTNIFTHREPTKKDLNDLYEAASAGNLEGVKFFAERWPGFVDSRARGWTAIHAAVSRGHRHVADYLGQFDFDVNQEKSFPLFNQLIHAHKDGDPNSDLSDFAALLIQRGVDLTYRDENGDDYLMAAKVHGCAGLVPLIERAMVEKGLVFPPTEKERAQEKVYLPFIRAVKNARSNSDLVSPSPRDIEAIKASLVGVDPYADVRGGRSAMTFAIEEAPPQAFIVLTMLNLDLSRPDARGITPLMAAASIQRGPRKGGHDWWTDKPYCLTYLANMLLSLGVDPALKDVEGRTAHDYAVKAGHAKLAEKIRKLQEKCVVKAPPAAPQPGKGAFNL